MKKTVMLLSILSFLLYNCKEGDVINTPEITSDQSCRDHLICENIFTDLGRVVQEGLTDNGQKKSYPIYTLINSNESDLDTLIINFGNTNYLYNNKLRRGIINITYTGKYNDSLSIITTTFDNYYQDNNLIEGQRIITNQGKNNNNNTWFTLEINNVSITTPLNGTIDWEALYVIEWIDGEETYFNISDDKYNITGNASGNGVNGNDFKMKITDTLNVELGCLPSCVIKSGNSIISPNGYTDRTINYGDSVCDCNVTLIINGETYPIIIGN